MRKDTLSATAYETALKMDTTQSNKLRAEMYGEAGSTWMKLKSWERAADNFEKRIQLDSSAVGAYINYAQCMIQIDRYEKASNALKKAIIKNPKYPPAYVNLGFCYFQMKDFDAGRKEFESAIEITDPAESKFRPELADANRMIALAIMLEKKTTPEASKKKWEEALTYLKKSVIFKEDVGQTHLLLGQCYQNLNKKEDAIREYKRTLKLEPKNEQAQKGLEMLAPN
jgi:tetratricopeptide (TPR) repeat protein